MHIYTGSNKPMDFVLSGRETQDKLNVEKYIALAYNNTRGVALAGMVEKRWADWVTIVARAPWLRNWSRSPLKGQVATSPKGQICENVAQDSDLAPYSGIALAIYTNTVWGLGFDNWLRGSAQVLEAGHKTSLGAANSRTRINEPMACMLKLQAIKCPNQARTYMWAEPLYRGCGMHMPIEVGELDRWLEGLWFDVLEQEHLAREQAYRNSLK